MPLLPRWEDLLLNFLMNSDMLLLLLLPIDDPFTPPPFPVTDAFCRAGEPKGEAEEEEEEEVREEAVGERGDRREEELLLEEVVVAVGDSGESIEEKPEEAELELVMVVTSSDTDS